MKKKITSALAATLVATTLVVAPVAPANAAPRYVVCSWFPAIC
ncbi:MULTISPECIES: hypothetical protein [Kocuria]|uniref:Uncharacterized protein n=1 Tax=Kocuria oceani TaxID=988827 RepID=A0ABV9TH71_9MICC|nr:MULTISPECIES: hypothetical protein [Kocuria]